MLVKTWSNRNSRTFLVGMQPCGIVRQFLTKHILTIQSGNHTCIYPKDLKTYFHTKLTHPMFTATLFIIANTWKQPRCPSVGERINDGTSRQEYYLALKVSYQAIKTWRKLVNIK